MIDHTKLASQLRTIASRGKVDDADVQILFDCADRLDVLRNYNSQITADINEAHRDLWRAQDVLASTVQDARDWQDRAWAAENELRELAPHER